MDRRCRQDEADVFPAVSPSELFNISGRKMCLQVKVVLASCDT